MWVTILLQAIFFAVEHVPEMIEILKSIFSMFKSHRTDPNLSGWVTEFSSSMAAARVSNDPRPLVKFLEKLKNRLS